MIDTANAGPGESVRRPWPAGTHSFGVPPFASMERIDPTAADTPSNWATCLDAVLHEPLGVIYATPAQPNSVFQIPPVVQIILDPPFPSPNDLIHFRARLLRDANRPIVSYRWVFGDGADMLGEDAFHAYAAEGSYDVLLLLIDTAGRETAIGAKVHVVASSPPQVDFSVLRDPEDPILRAGSPILFRDESFSRDAALVAWSWQFGDGSQASGAQVTHTYASAGEYIVTLEATHARALSGVQTQSLAIAHRLPNASFSVSTERAVNAEPLIFDARASSHPDGGAIVLYRWDFDSDGEIDAESETPSVEAIFPQPGTYSVRLTVVDAWGGTASMERSVQVFARPSAQFSVSSFSPEETELVTFEDRSTPGDAPIVGWDWAFGDGTQSTLTSPCHTFSTHGTFVVSLTVIDSMGASDTATAQLEVRNLLPMAALSVAEASLPTGSHFVFDAASSVDPSPEGGIVSYAWSLCSGCPFAMLGASPTLRHVFEEHGTYLVRVQVTDAAGATATSPPVSITVTNRPPTISSIRWDPDRPVDGEDVTLVASATDPDGSIAGWTWTLAGRVISTDAQPTIRFENSGSQEISLQVLDDQGAVSPPYSVSIDVANAPPVAAFLVQPGTLCVEGSVRLDASPSHDPSPHGWIAHLAWDFGDGSSCPGRSPGCEAADRWTIEHCYSTPGTYTVTLFVVDEKGALSTARKTISIHE